MPTKPILFQKILVPMDFSQCSLQAFSVGMELADIHQAHVTILHVQEPISLFGSEDDIASARHELDNIERAVLQRIDYLIKTGDLDAKAIERVSIAVRMGKPYREIVSYAHDNDFDLIVMGTHGHSGVKAIILGSQAAKVIRRATCPVMCIKPRDFEYRSFDENNVTQKGSEDEQY